ncbi:MAG: glycoside hydrolase family 13 protein [Candidatus Lokiarchaeota archaeon]|nr:glycoside hydrolase family 13 protein [Candidatus Harpocratesius repetitus]
MCKYHINIKVELWKLFIVLLLIIPFSSLNQTSISHISDNNEQFPSNSIIIAENPLISSKIGHFDNEIDRTAVYHNSRDPFYRNPGWGTTEGIERSGAVPVGTDVTIRIRTLASDVEDVKIRYWDGMAESENFITLSVTLTQDGYDYWEGVIPSPTEPDDFYYGFQLTDGTNTDYYHDDNKDGGAGQMYGYRYTDQDWGIVFYDPTFHTPDWHKSTIGYQIFTDRFFNGDPTNDPIGDGSSGDITWFEWDDGVYDFPRVYAEKKNWGETPSGGNDFFGGDLAGVMQKAGYLEDLGIGMIWFNPISESPDNHGYSVNNYTSIQPYYGKIKNRTNGIVISDKTGSLDVFDTLQETLESAGIKVIYDTVINHASAQSYLFQRFDTTDHPEVVDLYPNILGAYENPGSPYYHSFRFYTFPNDYDAWWGFKNIPTLIYDDPNSVVEDLLVTGDTSLFMFWQQHGVDGFRLDVPNMYQDGHGSRDLNQKIRDVVKANNPDGIVIGEIWGRANAWLTGTMQDGVQNMLFREDTIDWLKGTISKDIYSGRLLYPQENYPSEAFRSLWTILGNHDTARILTALGENVNRLKMASALQFTYPGVPMVYYGDEVGMTGGSDPGCRQTFPWGSENMEILNHYKTLIHMRKNYELFQSGSFNIYPTNQTDILIYTRELGTGPNSTAICVFNRGDYPLKVTLPADLSAKLSENQKLVNLLNPSEIVNISSNNGVSFIINAQTPMIFINAASNVTTTTNDDTSTDDSTDNESKIPFAFSLGGFAAIITIMLLLRKNGKK